MSNTEQEYPTYQAVLKGKREIAKDTYEFVFEKPGGFSFAAGQNVKIFFQDLPEEKKHRTFTIASAPHESDLRVAMRIRESAFKERLMALEMESAVELQGPTGHKFFLHEDARTPAVFIAGGIGVVPAFSIIKDALHKNLPYTFTLLYSNRHEEDIAYREELKKLADEHENVQLIMTATKEGVGEWCKECGYIDADMIHRYVPEIQNAMFYVSGPPEMLSGMETLLRSIDIPEEHILTKKFSGY